MCLLSMRTDALTRGAMAAAGVFCSALQRVAVCCRVLPCLDVCYRVLQCVAVCWAMGAAGEKILFNSIF